MKEWRGREPGPAIQHQLLEVNLSRSTFDRRTKMAKYQVIEKTGKYLDEAGTEISKHDTPEAADAERRRLRQTVSQGDTRWYEVHPAK
jgi:hypothetical protein